MGGFKAHDWKLGRRLERQVELGPAGLSRRIVAAAAVVEAPGVKAERLPSAEGAQSRSKGDRPRTLDGRFGKRLGGAAGATAGSG